MIQKKILSTVLVGLVVASAFEGTASAACGGVCPPVNRELVPQSYVFSDEVDKPVQYNYGVSYGNEGRGGAAVLVPGYIHVLTPDLGEFYNLSYGPREIWEPIGVVSKQVSFRPEISGVRTKMRKDPAILAAYRKFCGAEYGMTEDDWNIVNTMGGAKGVPDELIQDCVYAK